MSNSLATAALLDAIRAAVLAGWGEMPISYGPPRTPLPAVPYAVVIWEPVDVSFNGPGATLGGPSQRNRFTIIGRFPFPSDPSQIISLQKVTMANALIAQLQTGPSFASVGLLPLATMVDAAEPDNPNEKAFEVTVSFSVITLATHS